MCRFLINTWVAPRWGPSERFESQKANVISKGMHLVGCPCVCARVELALGSRPTL